MGIKHWLHKAKKKISDNFYRLKQWYFWPIYKWQEDYSLLLKLLDYLNINLTLQTAQPRFAHRKIKSGQAIDPHQSGFGFLLDTMIEELVGLFIPYNQTNHTVKEDNQKQTKLILESSQRGLSHLFVGITKTIDYASWSIYHLFKDSLVNLLTLSPIRLFKDTANNVHHLIRSALYGVNELISAGLFVTSTTIKIAMFIPRIFIRSGITLMNKGATTVCKPCLPIRKSTNPHVIFPNDNQEEIEQNPIFPKSPEELTQEQKAQEIEMLRGYGLNIPGYT